MKKIALLIALPLALLVGGFSFTHFENEPVICYAANNLEADEFVSYWKANIRKTPETDICAISKEQYDDVYLRYASLSSSAKSVVDSTIDVGNYTIKDSMSMLINKFSSKTNTNQLITFNKSTTLTIIIVVGVLGMTSICGFYLLKTKKVIN